MALLQIFLAFAILAVIVVGLPLGAVWAVNTLFGLGIAYTVKTWVASLLLMVFFSISAK